jgi:hypothetical protein
VPGGRNLERHLTAVDRDVAVPDDDAVDLEHTQPPRRHFRVTEPRDDLGCVDRPLGAERSPIQSNDVDGVRLPEKPKHLGPARYSNPCSSWRSYSAWSK